MVQQFEEIILLFNNDPRGQEGARKFVEKAGFARCRNVILPFKDARDCPLNGLERYQMANEIMGSDFFKNENIKRPDDIKNEYMRHIIEGEKLVGRSIRIPRFNKIVGGHKTFRTININRIYGQRQKHFCMQFHPMGRRNRL